MMKSKSKKINNKRLNKNKKNKIRTKTKKATKNQIKKQKNNNMNIFHIVPKMYLNIKMKKKAYSWSYLQGLSKTS